MKNIALSVLACVMLFAGQLSCSSQRATPANRIYYGHISGAEIADFGSVKLDKPNHALTVHRFNDAAIGFQGILDQKNNASKSDQLAAYVGLLQAKPSVWVAEAKRLQFSSRSGNPIAQFKLGTILYYQWSQQRSTQDTTLAAKSQLLLNTAWNKSKLPIIGMMLKEVSVLGTSYSISHPGLSLHVSDQLIKQLAGSKAYLVYLKSAQGDQGAKAPSPQSIPTANLRPLRGIVREFAYQSQIQGGTAILKGNDVIFTPLPLSSDQKRAYEYMTAWMYEINKLIKARNI